MIDLEVIFSSVFQKIVISFLLTVIIKADFLSAGYKSLET